LIPVGKVPPELAAYLQELEDRIALVEDPKGPVALFTIASTSLTAALAVANVNRMVFVTDLNMTAHSNGAHWYRSDTGALIV